MTDEHGNPDPLGMPGLVDVEVLAPGARGMLYRARQPALDRDVAVRVVTHSQTAAPPAHPHLAGVYGTGRTALGEPYVLLPYLPGGSLADRLARRRLADGCGGRGRRRQARRRPGRRARNGSRARPGDARQHPLVGLRRARAHPTPPSRPWRPCARGSPRDTPRTCTRSRASCAPRWAHAPTRRSPGCWRPPSPTTRSSSPTSASRLEGRFETSAGQTFASLTYAAPEVLDGRRRRVLAGGDRGRGADGRAAVPPARRGVARRPLRAHRDRAAARPAPARGARRALPARGRAGEGPGGPVGDGAGPRGHAAPAGRRRD